MVLLQHFNPTFLGLSPLLLALIANRYLPTCQLRAELLARVQPDNLNYVYEFEKRKKMFTSLPFWLCGGNTALSHKHRLFHQRCYRFAGNYWLMDSCL